MKRLQKRKHVCPKVAVSGKSDIYICQSRANVIIREPSDRQQYGDSVRQAHNLYRQCVETLRREPKLKLIFIFFDA